MYVNLQVHEMVSCADNSIQNVPVYITVACFLVSEGASLETVSTQGFTPIHFCPAEYKPLLQLFAKPERSDKLTLLNLRIGVKICKPILSVHGTGEVIIEGVYPDTLLLYPSHLLHRYYTSIRYSAVMTCTEIVVY